MIENVRQSLNENVNRQKKEKASIPSQANLDAKSFIEYILENNDFDRQEILELKKKVAALKSRQNLNNKDYLKKR